MELSLDVRNWWVFVLRGLAAIAFGVVTWLMPAMALLTLVLLFGAYAIVDGVSALVAAVKAKRTAGEGRRGWLHVLSGVVSIAAGLVAFLYPGITALALLIIIAARAIAIGVLEIVAAVRLRKEIRGEWLLALSGVLSIALGVVLVLFPGAGALGLLLWIGAWAIIVGVLLTTLGIRLRTVKRRAFGEGGPVGGALAGSH
jgi:uncharacterized membrane protein HdeD (DUF308 family)